MPDKKCRKGHKLFKASRTKEEISKKKVPRQKQRFGSSERMSSKEKERILFSSDKVDKNKVADAKMAAELQGLQAGGERRGGDVSHTGDSCLEEMLQKVITLGTNGVEVLFQRARREMGALPKQMPGGEEGRRDNKNEQEQGRTSQLLVLLAPGGFNEGTPVGGMELDLPRVRGAHSECGGAGFRYSKGSK